MKSNIIFSIVIFILAGCFMNLTIAQVSPLVNYQGKLLKSDGVAEDGVFAMVFSIYSAETGGKPLWTETHTNVQVAKGFFNVLLGSINGELGNVFKSESGALYLGFAVGTEEEMTPRFRITGSPFAQRAALADDVAVGSIQTTDLADQAITAPKIAAGQVVKSINTLKDEVTLEAGANIQISQAGNKLTIQATGVQLPDGAVTTPKIVDNAVTQSKIADGAVTQSKLSSTVSLPLSGIAGGDLSGTYPNPNVIKINGWPVATTAPISGQVLQWNGSIWTPAASGAQPSGPAGGDLTGNYPNPTIANRAIDENNMNDQSVSTRTIFDGAVTSAKIAENAVSSTHISPSTDLSISKLVAANTIHSKSGGFIFPDYTIQSTAVDSSKFSVKNHNHFGESWKGIEWYGFKVKNERTDLGNPMAISAVLAPSNLDYSPGSPGAAVFAAAKDGYGILATSENSDGIRANSTNGFAGYFLKKVQIQGYLTKTGGGFHIDHPLDPAGKYLNHSFVESTDMMNIYNGMVILNNDGEAEIELPDWFEALNKDFRYQLTAIGVPSPNLFIAEKILKGRFKIAGGSPGSEVSWQVTGIRQDAWANENRPRIEEPKVGKENGLYLHPEVYGKSENLRIGGLERANQNEE